MHAHTNTHNIHVHIHACRDTSERTLDLFDFREVKLVTYLFHLTYSLKLNPYHRQDMLCYNHFFINREESCILFLVMVTAYFGPSLTNLLGMSKVVLHFAKPLLSLKQFSNICKYGGSHQPERIF